MPLVSNSNLTPFQLRALATNEQAGRGFTHMSSISCNDLTQTTANTAQTITLYTMKIGDSIAKILWRLKPVFDRSSPPALVVGFKQQADTAFNSDTMSVGFTGTVSTGQTAGVAGLIAAKEVNVNGTVIPQFQGGAFVGAGIALPIEWTAASGTLTVTFNSMANKSLSTLDVGEVEIFIQLIRASELVDATTQRTFTK